MADELPHKVVEDESLVVLTSHEPDPKADPNMPAELQMKARVHGKAVLCGVHDNYKNRVAVAEHANLDQNEGVWKALHSNNHRDNWLKTVGSKATLSCAVCDGTVEDQTETPDVQKTETLPVTETQDKSTLEPMPPSEQNPIPVIVKN